MSRSNQPPVGPASTQATPCIAYLTYGSCNSRSASCPYWHVDIRAAFATRFDSHYQSVKLIDKIDWTKQYLPVLACEQNSHPKCFVLRFPIFNVKFVPPSYIGKNHWTIRAMQESAPRLKLKLKFADEDHSTNQINDSGWIFMHGRGCAASIDAGLDALCFIAENITSGHKIKNENVPAEIKRRMKAFSERRARLDLPDGEWLSLWDANERPIHMKNYTRQINVFEAETKAAEEEEARKVQAKAELFSGTIEIDTEPSFDPPIQSKVDVSEASSNQSINQSNNQTINQSTETHPPVIVKREPVSKVGVVSRPVEPISKSDQIAPQAARSNQQPLNQSTHQPNNQSVNQSINQSNNQSVRLSSSIQPSSSHSSRQSNIPNSQSINQTINQSIHQSSNRTGWADYDASAPPFKQIVASSVPILPSVDDSTISSLTSTTSTSSLISSLTIKPSSTASSSSMPSSSSSSSLKSSSSSMPMETDESDSFTPSLDIPCLSLFNPAVFKCGKYESNCPYFHQPDLIVPALSELKEWEEFSEYLKYEHYSDVPERSVEYTPFIRFDDTGRCFACLPMAAETHFRQLVRAGQFPALLMFDDIERQFDVELDLPLLDDEFAPWEPETITCAKPMFVNCFVVANNNDDITQLKFEQAVLAVYQRIEAAIAYMNLKAIG